MSVHDHSGFDRTDPNLKRSIAAIAPTVRALLDEREKAEPVNADQHFAWSSYIQDLEAEIAAAARVAGIEPEAMIAEAERVLRRRSPARAAAPASSTPIVDAKLQPLPDRQRRLAETAALENETLSAEALDIDRQISALLRRRRQIDKKQRQNHKVLFVGRGRG